MASLTEVPIAPISLERFRRLLGEEYAEVEEAIARSRELFHGRVVWHVNSTARGGGVAEMLHSLLAYARGAGVDVRWVTIAGEESFFRITKRIHNHLHGAPGDGGELGEAERGTYERTLAKNADELRTLVQPGDVVYLHDPQTAGLTSVTSLRRAHVVWRCHVGLDRPNDLAKRAWAFLRPYVVEADAFIFSREAFAWEGLEREKLWLIPPSIDAFSPKNQDLEPGAVSGILATIVLTADNDEPPVFTRQDGSPARVDRPAELDQDGPVPGNSPLVVQVSRWDRLKDPAGVMRSFAEHLSHPTAHLLLAGPSVAEVADDPEGAEVWAEIREQRAELPANVRSRAHLACLPMDDMEENAAVVNAIQRRADVVVQKSLAEGFGLTVAEAMFKAKPVVASRIGGIQDQIVDGESGLLIDDPRDLAAVAAAIDRLIVDPDAAAEMGAAARERVRRQFLGTRHLIQYTRLLARLLDAD